MTRPNQQPGAVPPDAVAREQAEREWIERMRAGDAVAFEALFRAYYRQLAVFAYRYVRSRETAEEVVHDVLARLWQRREQFELRDQLRTYLYTAVRNEALSRLRHAVVEHRWRERVLRQHRVEPAAGAPNDIEALVQNDELAAALERALAEVPERCRLALTLRWQQQMSYAEIAELMGISVKSVEVYIHRGLIALRAAHAVLSPHR